MVILFEGFQFKHYLIKSMKSGDALGKNPAKLFLFYIEIPSKTYYAKGALISSKSSYFGLPINSIIFSI